jgi:hypothetical protein
MIELAAAVLLFRIINAFSSNTYFDPDEHYQSHEVAYSAVYNVGFRTWEWHVGLRSFLHPALLAMFYSLCTPHHAQILIKVPTMHLIQRAL